MPALTNLTPFAVVDFPSITREGEECLVVVVAGTFELPAAATAARSLRRSELQPSPPPGDVYRGEPGRSSLLRESEAVYMRPGTDVLVHGHAWAPGGRATTHVRVAVQVGPAKKAAIVTGPRVWYRGALGLDASEPERFESLPLVYERSFGGTTEQGQEPRNPVGTGFYTNERAARDRPLPCVEDPAAPVRTWQDRPRPCGFGPVGRGWQPRLALAGTYDDGWVRQRAPLWPLDLDLRFFHGAPAELQVTPHLRGGERVVLEGLAPAGTIACSLAEVRLVGKCTFMRRSERRAFVLDAVHLDLDARQVTQVWRATFMTRQELADHEVTTVRLLEPWEDPP
jgi:hypothetical protein